MGTLRSVLRIARLANYELSWRLSGTTWHGYSARTFAALSWSAAGGAPTGLSASKATVSVEALRRTTE
jgi:hypothetical protein